MVVVRSFFQKMTHSTAKARQNRTASRFSGLMLSRPTLANSSDVLLAKITPASSHSALFLLMMDPSEVDAFLIDFILARLYTCVKR